MSFRKFQAEKIFNGKNFLDAQQVLITNSDGTIEAIVPEAEAGMGIQKLDGILSPGFINSHCHLELSHMKGRIPEKTGLVDFVYRVVTERHFAEEEILQAIADAENGMIAAGIVAVGDICNNTLTIPQKRKEKLAYYNFIECSGWLPAIAGMRFERAKQLYNQYIGVGGQGSTELCSIVPHAPYSVSTDLWNFIQPYFQNKTISIHNQETAFEDEFFLQGTGDFTRMYGLMNIDNSHHRPTKTSSLQSYFERLMTARKILLVHNTFTQQSDLNFIDQLPTAGYQLYFCLCINANQYIEDSLPPVELLRQAKANIVLGTDSLASNWRLSIADEINTIRRHFPSISLEEILQWATLNGARALEMQETLGSFEKGKKPGIIHFDENLSFINRL